jgi:hypothetical protein
VSFVIIVIVMKAQKERNVLKHQSTLLLADVMGDEKAMLLLQEVEVLKRTLEEEQQKHAIELQELQVWWRAGNRDATPNSESVNSCKLICTETTRNC